GRGGAAERSFDTGVSRFAFSFLSEFSFTVCCNVPSSHRKVGVVMVSCTSDLPWWVSYGQALAVPIISLAIAGAGWYVALRQAKLAEAKFKTDEFYRLYEKRFSTFEQTRLFLADVVLAKISDESIKRFWFYAADAEFLFDQNVSDFLKVVHQTAVLYFMRREEMKVLPSGREKDAKRQEMEKHQYYLMSLGEGENSFVNIFRPFLQKNDDNTFGLCRYLWRCVRSLAS
ncbi:MAG: hypothetical protein WCD42_00600, partial [Rhizomicrobium sp.]